TSRRQGRGWAVSSWSSVRQGPARRGCWPRLRRRRRPRAGWSCVAAPTRLRAPRTCPSPRHCGSTSAPRRWRCSRPSSATAPPRREALAERLDLAPLSPAAGAALVDVLSGQPTAPAVAAALHQQTDGNPFFLHELVRQLQAEGRDLADPAVADDARPVPAGV